MLTLHDCDQLFPLLAREANVRSSQLLHRPDIGLNAERNQDYDRTLIWATSARALTWPMFAAVMTRVNLLSLHPHCSQSDPHQIVPEVRADH